MIPCSHREAGLVEEVKEKHDLAKAGVAGEE
jgi:hypothetical protein